MPNQHQQNIHLWSDQELAQGCRRNEPQAQRELYQRHYGQLLGIPMRYCNSSEEAREVLNTGFLKIFTALTGYEEINSLKGWMSTIIFRATMDYVRSRTAYRKRNDFSKEADVPINNPALDNLAAEELFELIQKLPASSRAVFNLFVVEGCKHSEIAEILSIDQGTSRWHLSNARTLLKAMLQQDRRTELSLSA